MLKRVVYSILIIFLLTVATYAIFSFGRGYRFDLGKKSVTSTGILVASSSPEGASVYINGKLSGATNSSINTAPGWYDIKIVKEGYIPWQKKIIIKGEIVTKADALLIPYNPSLKPLTSSGVLSPQLSPSGNELAYIVPLEATSSAISERGGVWIWNLKEGPLLPIGNGPKLLARSTQFTDFTHGQILWSPDEKNLLILLFKDNKISGANLVSAYLLDTSQNDQIAVSSLDNLDTILSNWQDIEAEKNKTILSSLPLPLSDVLEKNAANLDFSLDENKLMYEATNAASIPQIITPPLIGSDSTPEDRNLTPRGVYIYDIKEDKNYKVKQLVSTTPSPSQPNSNLETSPPTIPDIVVKRLVQNHQEVQWYPDSKHILMIENVTIYIMEYDGINKTTIYAGPLEDSYLFPWPGGGRILILTSLNKAANLYPNLYAVDIR